MLNIIASQFAMSYGSYNLNLGPEILILGGDIRSRSWPNIGDSYVTFVFFPAGLEQKSSVCTVQMFIDINGP